MNDEETTPTPPPAPVLRVVRGDATPEEVAALIGVVAAMAGGQAPAKPARSPWVTTSRRGRYAPRPSPTAWVLSTRFRG